MMTRFNFPFGGSTVIAWFAINAWAVMLPLNGDAFETRNRGRLSPLQYSNEDGNVLVFDNDLLDRLFGKDRAAEKRSNNGEPHSGDTTLPKVFSGTNSSTVLPNRSLLAGISTNTNSRRAAALRLAEKGRRLIQDREYQKAISYLEKALSLDASPFIHFYLAWAHYHLGDNRGSLNFLEVAESRLYHQPEWMGELTVLRSAVSAPPAPQQIASRQNAGWTYADY
jgi:tetratricopeptide (TPR) repeat protein